ncbi:hypothetical protein, partial [Erythrobacter donghaensis]|uniref:hypothetical protein n=1 Tax=Erythrobacter donghaensis TaxID=267135 RepID=UPI001E50EA8F
NEKCSGCSQKPPFAFPPTSGHEPGRMCDLDTCRAASAGFLPKAEILKATPFETIYQVVAPSKKGVR